MREYPPQIRKWHLKKGTNSIRANAGFTPVIRETALSDGAKVRLCESRYSFGLSISCQCTAGVSYSLVYAKIFSFSPQKQLLNIFRTLSFMAGLVKSQGRSRNNYSY